MKSMTFTCPKRNNGRGRNIAQAVMVIATINFATASHPRHVLPSPLIIHAVPVTDGQDHTRSNAIEFLLPKMHGPRRCALSKIAHIRGGSSSSGFRCDGESLVGGNNGNKSSGVHDRKSLKHYSNEVLGSRGGSTQSSQILSIIFLIVDQSINLASAALITSGYLGAWMASWMIHRMHKILPLLTKKAAESGTSAGKNNLLLGKYQWTTLATIGFFLLHLSGIQPNSIYSRMSDASFVAMLWAYSNLVNPILGGVIGCTHVSLGIISLLLGNQSLDHLGDIRLEKLGQYTDEKHPYIASREERISQTKFNAAAANVMGSASLLTVFPQYFLGLYMLGSTLVSWSSTGKYVSRTRRFVKWLSEEICVSYDENGKLLDCGIGAAATGSAMSENLNPWKVSKRLVALYWIIAGVKTAITVVLL
mmetsp:Transcript_16492/g.39482  ORF Transcript_16492/g.39482 Transcript_16492/m.39482 type:complete len:420 (+) Transcript_16492:122-1381(+)